MGASCAKNKIKPKKQSKYAATALSMVGSQQRKGKEEPQQPNNKGLALSPFSPTSSSFEVTKLLKGNVVARQVVAVAVTAGRM